MWYTLLGLKKLAGVEDFDSRYGTNFSGAGVERPENLVGTPVFKAPREPAAPPVQNPPSRQRGWIRPEWAGGRDENDSDLTFKQLLPEIPAATPDAPGRDIIIRVNGASIGPRKFDSEYRPQFDDFWGHPTITADLPFDYANGPDSALAQWLTHYKPNIRPNDNLTVLGHSTGAAVLAENADTYGRLGVPMNYTLVDPAAPWYHPLGGFNNYPKITEEQAKRFKNFRVYSAAGDYSDLQGPSKKWIAAASLANVPGVFPAKYHQRIKGAGHLFSNYRVMPDGTVTSDYTPGTGFSAYIDGYREPSDSLLTRINGWLTR